MTDVRAPRSSVPWSLWRFVRFVFGHVIWSPIAAGRLKATGWPVGLRGIAVAWAVVYVAMMAAAVFSAAIRSRTTLAYDGINSIPAVTLPLVTVAFVFAFTCLYVAGLHLVWWLRVPVVLVVVASLVRLAYLPDPAANDVVVLVAAGLLVVMLAVRWGRRFHWAEFVVALAVVGHGLLAAVIFLPDANQIAPTDPRLIQLQLLAESAWTLAVPIGLVAGAAVAELTVSTVAWTVTGVSQAFGSSRRWSPRWGIAVIVALVVLRAVQDGWYVWSGDPGYTFAGMWPTGVMFAVTMLACALVTRVADRVPAGDPPVRPDPDDVVEHWSGWSIVLAVLLGVAVAGPSLVAVVADPVVSTEAGRAIRSVGGEWQLEVLAVAGSCAALVLAVVLARRGRRVAPLILTATAVWTIASAVPSHLNLVARESGLTVTASLAAVVVFCWLVARRRLTAVRGAALATVLVLCGVVRYRDVLEEPLTAAFSLVGVSAAVLVGLIWRMLTDAGYSRGDSRRFPRPSRVLVVLAGTCYAVTSIAVAGLVGGSWAFDFNRLEFVGDFGLGRGLVCAALFGGLSLAARGRLVHSDQPRDDRGRLLPPGVP